MQLAPPWLLTSGKNRQLSRNSGSSAAAISRTPGPEKVKSSLPTGALLCPPLPSSAVPCAFGLSELRAHGSQSQLFPTGIVLYMAHPLNRARRVSRQPDRSIMSRANGTWLGQLPGAVSAFSDESNLPGNPTGGERHGGGGGCHSKRGLRGSPWRSSLQVALQATHPVAVLTWTVDFSPLHEQGFLAQPVLDSESSTGANNLA